MHWHALNEFFMVRKFDISIFVYLKKYPYEYP